MQKLVRLALFATLLVLVLDVIIAIAVLGGAGCLP